MRRLRYAEENKKTQHSRTDPTHSDSTVLTSEDPKGADIAPERIAKRLGRTSLKGATYLLNRSASI